MTKRLDTYILRAAIDAAPAFAKFGLSVRDERCQEGAADALSIAILKYLGELPVHDHRQLSLPLSSDRRSQGN